MMITLNKKNVVLLCTSFALVFCGGCATKKLDQQKTTDSDARIYTVSATSQEDIDALNDTANRAVQFCHKQKKFLKIANYEAKYMGLTDDQKKLVHKANQEFGEDNGTFSDRDYKATLKFTCIE